MPDAGGYGVGMLYMPQDEAARQYCESLVERVVTEEGQAVLGWRTVPTNGRGLGKGARSREPFVRQVFIGRNDDALPKTDELAFERKLYVIRRRTENEIQQARAAGEHSMRQTFLLFEPLRSHPRLQGHVALCAVDGVLPGFAGPGHGNRAGADPFPL